MYNDPNICAKIIFENLKKNIIFGQKIHNFYLKFTRLSIKLPIFGSLTKQQQSNIL